MKRISAIDLHFLLKEAEILKDSRIDKIFQPEKETIIFSLYKTNSGKKLLRIDVGKSVYILEEKEAYEEILGFGQALRKHLDGHFLADIEQLKPERIIKLAFKAKDSTKYLYIEFIGKGNAILCNEHNVIINAIDQHDYSARSIRSKLKYTYPIMNYNIFDLNENDLITLLKKSEKGSLVICLATELGSGGLYSEEICLLSGIDKNASPSNIDEKQVTSILNSVKKILNKKTEAKVIFDENGSVIDVAPFELEFYSSKKYKKQKFDSFHEAVNFFYSSFKELKETAFDKKLKSLQRIVEGQKSAIEQLRKDEHELRQKGEFIYHNYSLVKEILEEINKASKKYSWKEIKEKLKGHKIIKEINEKDRKVVVDI